MPAFLPEPRDDEMLYSIIARYGAMLGASRAPWLAWEFFGALVPICADQPRALDGPGVSALGGSRVVLERYTAFPYLYSFSTPPVFTAMLRSAGSRVSRSPSQSGVMATAFPRPESLRICLTCFSADQDRSGIAHWRRVHQLPGVLVCPIHGSSLGITGVSRNRRAWGSSFVPLTAGIAQDAAQIPIPRGPGVLLDYAKASAELLDFPPKPCDTSQLQARLRELLGGYRWSRAPSLIETGRLAATIGRHPRVRPLLSALSLKWTESQFATAINRLLYREEVSKHPLLVLIALELAGANLDDLKRPAADRPFQKACRLGPRAPVIGQPCGNPSCSRFTDPPAHQLSERGLEAKILIACPVCGFTYRWTPRRPASMAIVSAGPAWDAALRSRLSDPSVSVRTASGEFAVAPIVIVRNARRLGMWRPEWSDSPKRRLRQRDRVEQRAEQHRLAWSSWAQADTRVPINQAPRGAFNAYRFLMRHDRDWLRRTSDGMYGRYRIFPDER